MASSRSHSLFQLVVDSINPDNNGKLVRAKLNLCDLAGSEKIYAEDKIGENHMEEHKNINLSLSTLGKVVGALSKNKVLKHIPFRESKLTRLLKDSLGGKFKIYLLFR
jgi:kinesin family protein 11